LSASSAEAVASASPKDDATAASEKAAQAAFFFAYDATRSPKHPRNWLSFLTVCFFAASRADSEYGNLSIQLKYRKTPTQFLHRRFNVDLF